MGKRNGSNDKPTTTPENQNISLREENIGRKHIDVSSMLKLEHLQKLAVWATGQTPIPSLGALYGQRLAASAELAGVPLERALFVCQRCETVLQPGDNCSIRIESHHDRSKRKKSRLRQNSVVYTCHFCSNRNLIKGSARGCVKELLGSRTKRFPDINEASKEDTAVQVHVHANATENPKTPETPFTPRSFLSGKRTSSLGSRSCNSNNSRKDTTDLSITKVRGGSSKRKRRRGSSLRDIVENNENSNRVNISNLIIPLKL